MTCLALSPTTPTHPPPATQLFLRCHADPCPKILELVASFAWNALLLDIHMTEDLIPFLQPFSGVTR